MSVKMGWFGPERVEKKVFSGTVKPSIVPWKGRTFRVYFSGNFNLGIVEPYAQELKKGGKWETISQEEYRRLFGKGKIVDKMV